MTTKYHRYCASAPDHKCRHKPDCELDCHFDSADQAPAGWRGQNLPVTMKADWLDDIKDFFFAVVWWSGTLAIFALVVVAASLIFGMWL